MEKENFENKIKEYYERKQENFPTHSNRASGIGHPCMRYLVYCRTSWDKALPLSPYSHMIFGEGNDQEKAVTQWLEELGYRAYLQNMSFPKNDLNLTGHIDGVLADTATGEEVPFDIKTCDPNLYPQIQTIEDFERRYWMKKWEWQMQAYMMLSSYPKFWILLKNKTAKDLRVIEILADGKKFIEIENKCKLINKHVEKKTFPEREVNVDICKKCEYRHICLPPIKMDAAKMIEDHEFLGMLEKREELYERAKEYEKLDRSIKHLVKDADGDKFICNEFVIEKKLVQKKEYTVSASEYCRVSIIKLDLSGSNPDYQEV
jgi:hypothetical protein